MCVTTQCLSFCPFHFEVTSNQPPIQTSKKWHETLFFYKKIQPTHLSSLCSVTCNHRHPTLGKEKQISPLLLLPNNSNCWMERMNGSSIVIILTLPQTNPIACVTPCLWRAAMPPGLVVVIEVQNSRTWIVLSGCCF